MNYIGTTTNTPTRVTLAEALFTEAQLAHAMSVDKSINDYHGDIYQAGIERQASGGTLTEAQAKAINITHKKIAKALDNAGEPVVASDLSALTNRSAASTSPLPVAQRIDAHLGNLIAEMQALRSLFNEMQ